MTVTGLTDPPATQSPVTSDVSMGLSHGCALLANGEVWCWGNNADGQLGLGTTDDTDRPYPVAGITSAIGIDSGGNHTCAVLANSTVRCWGDNVGGQLGDNTTTDRLTPVAVAGLAGVAQVAAGGVSTCARRTNGTVACWGFPYAGLTEITGITDAVSITSGSLHSCATLVGGSVRCWGTNAHGQLGNGTTTDSPTTPVDVTGITGATTSVAGGDHSCAVIAGGAVRCWGRNTDGQLGNGTTTSSNVPVPVTGLTGAVDVTAGTLPLPIFGTGHSCALLGDGSARCWGDNAAAQLGDNTTTDRLTPVPVSGLAYGTSLDVGGWVTCAVATPGAVTCWGADQEGMLGDGPGTTPGARALLSTLLGR